MVVLLEVETHQAHLLVKVIMEELEVILLQIILLVVVVVLVQLEQLLQMVVHLVVLVVQVQLLQ